jgi:PKD repeat protein
MDDGIYTAGIRVKDDDGGIGTATTDVVILDLAPIAEFNWSPEPQNEGSAVQFSDESTSYPDVIVAWSWDFGDTNTSNEQNPVHTYGDNDTYTVNLTVTDDDGSQDTISYDVSILNVSPIAEIDEILPSQEVFTGETVSFSGSFTDPGWLDTHTVEWDFGDGNTATGLNVTHIYNKQDSYTVTFTVTDDDGGVDIATAEMIVKPIPAIIDFKPNTLNLRGKGKWVTVYIELGEDYDVSLIDINTVLFNDQIPAENDPKYDFVTDPEIKDRNDNGLPELMVKFDRSQVQSILSPGEEVTITVTGGVFHIYGLADFEGGDVIRVIDKKK